MIRIIYAFSKKNYLKKNIKDTYKPYSFYKNSMRLHNFYKTYEAQKIYDYITQRKNHISQWTNIFKSMKLKIKPHDFENHVDTTTLIKNNNSKIFVNSSIFKKHMKNIRKKLLKKTNLTYLSRLSRLHPYGSLSIYHLPIMNKFINHIMRKGKKSIAEKIFYKTIMDLKKKKLKPKKIFKKAIINSKPFIELKSYRRGGKTLQIPKVVSLFRQSYLAIKWILETAKENHRLYSTSKLAEELLNSSKKKGKAQSKILSLYKSAKENIIYLKYNPNKKNSILNKDVLFSNINNIKEKKKNKFIKNISDKKLKLLKIKIYAIKKLYNKLIKNHKWSKNKKNYILYYLKNKLNNLITQKKQINKFPLLFTTSSFNNTFLPKNILLKIKKHILKKKINMMKSESKYINIKTLKRKNIKLLKFYDKLPKIIIKKLFKKKILNNFFNKKNYMKRTQVGLNFFMRLKNYAKGDTAKNIMYTVFLDKLRYSLYPRFRNYFSKYYLKLGKKIFENYPVLNYDIKNKLKIKHKDLIQLKKFFSIHKPSGFSKNNKSIYFYKKQKNIFLKKLDLLFRMKMIQSMYDIKIMKKKKIIKKLKKISYLYHKYLKKKKKLDLKKKNNKKQKNSYKKNTKNTIGVPPWVHKKNNSSNFYKNKYKTYTNVNNPTIFINNSLKSNKKFFFNEQEKKEHNKKGYLMRLKKKKDKELQNKN